MRLISTALLAAAIGLIAWEAGAQEANSDGTLELGLWKRLNAREMLYLPMSITRSGETDHAEALVGISYDRKFSHGLSARAGYRYLWELSHAEGETPYREHRGVGELFVRPWEGAMVELLDRTRLELRLVDHVYSWRLKNRLRGAKVVSRRGGQTVAPYGAFEAGYDSRYRTINRVRATLGVATRFTSRVMVDAYTARQRDSREAPTGQSIGVTVNLTRQ